MQIFWQVFSSLDITASMAVQNEFVAYLLELLEPFGPVKAKAMFGGFGIYRHDLMFGLVARDTLYLKVDDKNRADFEARGLAPFTYRKKGEGFSMSYFQAPYEAIDDAECLSNWAQKAYDAAMRAAQSERKKNRGKW
jgi:DNA transformation protein